MRAVTVTLDEDSIEKMDAVRKKLNMSRGQFLRLIFSGDEKNIRFVCDTLISFENSLYGGAYDRNE